MRHDLNRPCKRCPFRTDVAPFLSGGRAMQIVRALLDGHPFACHETIDHDEDGEGIIAGDSEQCAGASIMLARVDRTTKHRAFAERIGMPVAELDMDSPVYESPKAMLRAYVGGGR